MQEQGCGALRLKEAVPSSAAYQIKDWFQSMPTTHPELTELVVLKLKDNSFALSR
jgi:hypothetical protein